MHILLHVRTSPASVLEVPAEASGTSKIPAQGAAEHILLHVRTSPASVLEAPAEASELFAAELFAVAISPATVLDAPAEAAELFACKTLGG